jgi:hypothetical protein
MDHTSVGAVEVPRMIEGAIGLFLCIVKVNGIMLRRVTSETYLNS